MSDRKATFVIAETAQSLGYDISDLSINRSTIKRGRERYRSEIAAALKNNLSSDVPLTVHWDGKLMQDLCGKDHVDRLPIIVTGFGVCQLLNVLSMSCQKLWPITDVATRIASSQHCRHRLSYRPANLVITVVILNIEQLQHTTLVILYLYTAITLTMSYKH